MTNMRRKKPISDQLRDAIRNATVSRYRLAAESGIDESTISRFLNGKGGLSIEGLDRIADCLGLRLVVPRRSRQRKGK